MALLTLAELKAVLGVGSLYPDETLEQVVHTAIELVSAYVDDTALEDEPAPVKEATLNLAVEIWSARMATGGQLQATDFQPSPWRLGRSLMSKVIGLLAPYAREGGMVG